MKSSNVNQRAINNEQSLTRLSREFAQEFSSLLAMTLEEIDELIQYNKELILQVAADKDLDLEFDAQRATLASHLLSAYFDAPHSEAKDKFSLNPNSLTFIPRVVSAPISSFVDDKNGIRAVMHSQRDVSTVLGTDTDLMYALKGVMLTDYSTQLSTAAAARKVNVLRAMPLDNFNNHFKTLVYPYLLVGQKYTLSIPVSDGGHWYALHAEVTRKENDVLLIHSAEVENSLTTSSAIKSKFNVELSFNTIKYTNNTTQQDGHSCMDFAAQAILKRVDNSLLNTEQRNLRDQNNPTQLRACTVQAILSQDASLRDAVGEHYAAVRHEVKQQLPSAKKVTVQTKESVDDEESTTVEMAPLKKQSPVKQVVKQKSTSVSVAQQVEADRLLAIKLQKEWNEAEDAARTQQIERDRLMAIELEKKSFIKAESRRSRHVKKNEEKASSSSREGMFSSTKNASKKSLNRRDKVIHSSRIS